MAKLQKRQKVKKPCNYVRRRRATGPNASPKDFLIEPLLPYFIGLRRRFNEMAR
jgi:hypothetical protein